MSTGEVNLKSPSGHQTDMGIVYKDCTGGSALLPTAGGFVERGSRLDAAVRAAEAPGVLV